MPPSVLLSLLPAPVLRVVAGRIVYANEAAGLLVRDSALVGRELSEIFQVGPGPDTFTVVRSGGDSVRVQASTRSLGADERIYVLHEVGDRPGDPALLRALSDLAVRVQRTRTTDGVLDAAAVGLDALGLGLCVLQRVGETLVLRRAGPAQDVARLEAVLSHPLAGLSVAVDQAPNSQEAFARGASVYVDDLGPGVLRFLHDAEHPGMDEMLEPLIRARRGVLSPVYVNGTPWGLVVLVSSTLTREDAPAIALFAAQLGSALEVAQTIEALDRTHGDLAALSAVAKVGSEEELAGVLPRILDIVSEATGSDVVAIGFYDAEHDELVGAGYHPSPGPFARLYHRIPLERSALGEGLRTFEARAFHVHDWPAWSRAEAAAEGFRELAVVPLHVQGRIVGTLDLARKSARPYTEEELRRVSHIGAQIGIQIENARLYSEAHRRVRHLSVLFSLARVGSEALEIAPLLDRVAELVSGALGADATIIHLVQDGRLAIAAHCGRQEPGVIEMLRELGIDDQSVAGRAALERRTFIDSIRERPAGHVPKCPVLHAQHVAATPVLARDRFLGTITVSRFDDRPFARDEVHLLESCAVQAGIAVEHAKLFEEERRRVHDLSDVHAFGTAMAGHLELPALLDEGVRHFARLADRPNVFVLLLDADGRHVRVVASNVERPDAREIVLPLEVPSAAANAIRTLRPLVLDEPFESHPAARELAARFGHRTLLAVPLVARNQAIGAVVLGETRERRRFRASEVERAVAVAKQLAVAVDNARLLGQARKRVDELRVLLDVGRVITGSLDLEQILEASARLLGRMVEASNAFILLLDPSTRLLHGVAASNPRYREQFRTVRISLDQASISAKSIRERRPQAMSDATAGEDVQMDLVRLYGSRGLLAIPLMLRDEPIGALVMNDIRPREWTASEVELATLIANQVAVAVANARLFDDLKRSYGDLARAQEELVKQERLAALGELAAVVAHEVRNPLGVIFNSIVSLRKILQPAGDASMLFTIVSEEADRLNRIVSDLLDFARPNTPAIQPESLADILSDVVDAATSDPTFGAVDVRLEVAQGLHPVGLDARLMRQALLNVVLNGIQSMPNGGTLTVRAFPDHLNGRACARVDVADMGPGIPRDLQPRIFQPFFTTKASGTGLGLAVVKRIMDAHRGEVTVDSRLGRGTIFTLRLPMEDVR